MHNLLTANEFFESAAKCNLATTVTNENHVRKETERCRCHSVWHLLSSHLLSNT